MYKDEKSSDKRYAYREIELKGGLKIVSVHCAWIWRHDGMMFVYLCVRDMMCPKWFGRFMSSVWEEK